MPMAEPSSSSAPNSCSSFPKVKHDVFLCFRGDTRYGFTAHLYAALRRKQVLTFMDDEDFEMGQHIDNILEDLRASRIAVVIFSEEFAASTYCLEELVTICECIDGERKTQEAVPIFYHVNPSEPQDLPEGGAYRKAFDDYRQSEDLAKVGAWERAMKRVANISGKELKKDRKEPAFIEMFVELILDKLKSLDYGFSSLPKNLIGMRKHMEAMRSYLDIDNRDVVRFIVISGMGGIGKTAIARLVYSATSYKFEGSSFLSDVSDARDNRSLLDLQRRLLSETLNDKRIEVPDLGEGRAEIKRGLCSRRVLVVLDDVDNIVQLENLIGVDDEPEGWFASGSRIIITTREKTMFDSLDKVDKKIYDVQGLTNLEALQLFCKKAFGIGCDEPPEGFEQLSRKFVEYADRLPLALDVIGTHLGKRKTKEVWESELKRMKEEPQSGIVDKLQRTLEKLPESEKAIFLDIAFFFRGENKDDLIKVLDRCNFHTICGLKTLEDNSLITIQDSKVLMHNLIQTVGREFVRKEDEQQPRNRSRLWLYKDIDHAFRCETGEINVQGISLESGGQEDMQLRGKAFTRLRYLRVLKFKNPQVSRQFEYLPDTLRYLLWNGYPFRCLPSRYEPLQLVELHLPSSEIKELWKGVKQKLENLRVMDLRNCKNLKKTINFKTVPNLEKLRLSGCTGLLKVSRSINDLKQLVLLDLEGCRSLQKFPKEISGLTSLQNLNLSECPKLGKLPKLGTTMTRLQELSAGRFDPAQRRSTAQSNPISLPDLGFLRKLHLIGCNLVEGAIAFDFSCFPLLESLNLSENDFVEVPEIVGLSKLEVLSLDNCKKLERVPHLPSSLKTLHMRNCTSLTSLQSLSQLSKLKDLVMEGCTKLENIPNPCEVCTSKSLHLNFASCLKLQVSRSWLESYLKMQRRYEYERIGELWMILPRSAILWFWKDTGDGNSFELSLPSNCLHNIMGFAFCAVIDIPKLRPDYSLKGSLNACTKQAQQGPLRKRLISVKINFDGAASDHLCFLYIPRDCSRSIEWWNKFTQFKFKAQFDYFDFRIKRRGFGIIYKEDVEDVENLNIRNISSENDDDDCNEDDNFLEFRLNDFRDDDDEEEY